jgi:hypothetical protein
MATGFSAQAGPAAACRWAVWLAQVREQRRLSQEAAVKLAVA